jgi:hypothetical protein
VLECSAIVRRSIFEDLDKRSWVDKWAGVDDGHRGGTTGNGVAEDREFRNLDTAGFVGEHTSLEHNPRGKFGNQLARRDRLLSTRDRRRVLIARDLTGCRHCA